MKSNVSCCFLRSSSSRLRSSLCSDSAAFEASASAFFAGRSSRRCISSTSICVLFINASSATSWPSNGSLAAILSNNPSIASISACKRSIGVVVSLIAAARIFCSDWTLETPREYPLGSRITSAYNAPIRLDAICQLPQVFVQVFSTEPSLRFARCFFMCLPFDLAFMHTKSYPPIKQGWTCIHPRNWVVNPEVLAYRKRPS